LIKKIIRELACKLFKPSRAKPSRARVKLGLACSRGALPTRPSYKNK